jgi:hypothetical protein
LPGPLIVLGVPILILHPIVLVLLFMNFPGEPVKLFYIHFGWFVLLIALATVQNILSLVHVHWRRIRLYPILAYNLLILICSFLYWRNLQPDAALSEFQQTIVWNYSRTQQPIFHYIAVFLPMMYFFPIMARPWKLTAIRTGLPSFLARLKSNRLRNLFILTMFFFRMVKKGLSRALRFAAVLFCLIVIVLYCGLWSYSGEVVTIMLREPEGPMPVRPDFQFGTKIRTEASGNPEERMDWYRQELAWTEDLGVDYIMHYIVTEFAEDPERREELKSFARLARENGYKIMVAMIGSEEWFQATADGIQDEEYRSRVQNASLWLAENIRPEILNPVVEPYGAQMFIGKRDWTPEQWRDFLSGIADEIHAIDPEIRVGVNNVREDMFRLVCDPTCSIDAVGMSINSMTADPDTIFEMYEKWLEHVPPEKECWIYEFALSPLNFGQTAQARYFKTIAHWAAGQPRMTGVSCYQTSDGSEVFGLIAFGRWKRPAFDAYRDAIRAVKGP